jgi:hypothetical protein
MSAVHGYRSNDDQEFDRYVDQFLAVADKIHEDRAAKAALDALVASEAEQWVELTIPDGYARFRVGLDGLMTEFRTETGAWVTPVFTDYDWVQSFIDAAFRAGLAAGRQQEAEKVKALCEAIDGLSMADICVAAKGEMAINGDSIRELWRLAAEVGK